jgi:hypothetical protein
MKRMKECGKYQPELADFVRKMVSPDEEKELIRHLADCSVCQQELRETEATLDILKQEKVPELPQAFWNKLTEGIRGGIEQKGGKTTIFRPKWALVPIAAILALLVAVSLFTVDRQNLAKKNTLPEGSLVWLETQAGEQNFDQVIDQTLADMNQEVEKAYWEEEDIVTLLAELSDQEFQTLEKKVKSEKF